MSSAPDKLGYDAEGFPPQSDLIYSQVPQPPHRILERRLIYDVLSCSMKSITVSVGFTAWILGQDPTRRIICVSYADDLARKLSVDTRTVIDSPWYRELFPGLQPDLPTSPQHRADRRPGRAIAIPPA